MSPATCGRLRVPLLLAMALIPFRVHAEDAKTRAAALAESAVVLGRSGDYTEALSLFEKAYALDPAPVLLYNIGRVAERAGDYEKAARALRDYLAGEGEPGMRAKAEEALRTVSARLPMEEPTTPTKTPASVVALPVAPVASAPTQAANDLDPRLDVDTNAETPKNDRALMWVLIGTGAVALVGGGLATFFVLRGSGPGAANDVWVVR